MRWAEGFIAADWGTTNRRAYLMDGGGKCVAEFEDDKGILGVPKGGFGDAVTEIRERFGDPTAAGSRPLTFPAPQASRI